MSNTQPTQYVVDATAILQALAIHYGRPDLTAEDLVAAAATGDATERGQPTGLPCPGR